MGFRLWRVSKSFIILAGHIENKMIINFLINFLNFIRFLWIFANSTIVISSILHYYLGMLFEVLFICTEIMEFDSFWWLYGLEVCWGKGRFLSHIYCSWCGGYNFTSFHYTRQSFPLWLRLLDLIFQTRINNFLNFLISLMIQIFLYNKSINSLPPPHFLIDIHKIIRIIKIHDLILNRNSIFNNSMRILISIHFQYFLKINGPYIRQYPFQFKMGYIDPTCHG